MTHLVELKKQRALLGIKIKTAEQIEQLNNFIVHGVAIHFTDDSALGFTFQGVEIEKVKGVLLEILEERIKEDE